MTGKKYLYVLIGSFVGGFLFFYFVFPLFISYGKVTKVPDLKNSTVERAMKILASMELKGVIVDSVYSDVIKKGRVVKTIPPPGKNIRFGRKVKLIVSKGGEKIPFPKVKGLNVDEARKTLLDSGFTNIVVINVPIPEDEKTKYKEGTVMDVSPDSVKELEKGEKITLFVVKFQKNVFLMPNLVGLSIGEAKKMLKRYNLALGEVKRISDEDSIVILQNPLPGIEVVYGESVNVVLGKKK